MSDQPARPRPRGLKRSAKAEPEEEVKPTKSARVEHETGEGPIHTEALALPEEVQGEEDDERDVFTLYASGLTQAAKGNDEVARKFLEGVVHELMSELERNETLPNDRLQLLGNTWVQIGHLIGDWEHVARGVAHLKEALESDTGSGQESKDSDPETSREGIRQRLMMDCAVATLGMYRLRRQPRPDHDNEDEPSMEVESEETEAVTGAERWIEVALKLNCSADQEARQSLLAEAASSMHQYAQTLPPAQLRHYAQSAAKLYRDALKTKETTEGQVSLGRCLVDAAETVRDTPQVEGEMVTGLLTEAQDVLTAAVSQLSADDDNDAETLTDVHKMLSEVFMHLGDVVAVGEDDDGDQSESSSYYQSAFDHIRKARDLRPDVVPEELFEMVRSVAEGEEDSEEEEGEEEGDDE
eukprot:comp20379_c0_seq1/m.25755 comp20379_c0_seq1/g.25755  ORF comp20379_c0_seq1/g.25755 comp20379_c0_seq1/m.25755 type:complete len:412 (-) comp20379_c0_seq1:32-1267(-)